MRRPLVPIAIGAAALGLSIPLALLGHAVLAAPDRVAAAVVTTSTTAVSHDGGSLFDSAAESLLGIDRADPFIRLAQEYRHAVANPIVTIDAAAPVRLSRLATDVGPRTEKSQARVMVGAVFALPAGNGSITFARMRELGGGRLLAEAAGEFREAAILDDRSEAAKYDLELLLRSEAAAAAREQRETTKAKRPTGRRKHQGQGEKHPPTRRKLREGGVYGSGSGY